MSQSAFIDKLMSKRQDFVLWKSISHITAIFGNKEGMAAETYRLRYQFREHQDNPLFSVKAKTYIQELYENYDYQTVLKDQRRQAHYLKEDLTKYLLYQAYKIVWYFEIVAKRHIVKMLFVFVKNTVDRYYIMDMRNIHHRPSDPQILDRYVYQTIQLRDPNFKRDYVNKILSEAYTEDPVKWANVERKRKELSGIYEEFKGGIKLDLYKQEPADKRSDEAFAMFHPELADRNILLSDILENQVELDHVKDYMRSLYNKKGVRITKSQMFRRTQPVLCHNTSSKYLLNQNAARDLQTRIDKGKTYQDPFGAELMHARKKMAGTLAKENRVKQSFTDSIFNCY